MRIIVAVFCFTLQFFSINGQINRAFDRTSQCIADNRINDMMEEYAERIRPDLNAFPLKGFMGTVGIVGGYNQDCASPYFAAMGALKVGADAVEIFCNADVHNTIQMMSPNMRVQPLFNGDEDVLMKAISRMDAVVLGTGVEPQGYSNSRVKKIIDICIKYSKPLVIDLNEYFYTPDILNRIKKMPPPGVILIVDTDQFEKIYGIMRVNSAASASEVYINFKAYGDNILIYRKGCTSSGISSRSSSSWSLSAYESKKKVSKRGSLVAGVTGTFFFWATRNINSNDTRNLGDMFPAAVASYSAAQLVRKTSSNGKLNEEVGMITSDLISELYLNS